MGIFSAIHDAILGPSTSTDTDLARNLQDRGIVDTQGKAVIDPSLVVASRTPEAKKQALEGQQAVERQVGYGVQENLDNVNQVASTIKKVASVPIPVKPLEYGAVSLLPSPFSTLAKKLVLSPENSTNSITPGEIAKGAVDLNMMVPKIAARTALEFAPPGTAIIPRTPEEKFLFGNEPITAITNPTNDSFLGMNIGSKAAKLVQAGLEKLGVPESPSRKIAGVGTGMFAAFVNNPFVGGEKKAAEETLSEIANLSKSEEILPKLQSLFHGADPEILKPLAEKLTEISDVGKVKETITSFLSGVGEEHNFVKQYVADLTKQQETARQSPVQSFVTKAKSIYQTLKKSIADSNAPIEDTLRQAERDYNFKVLPKNDITPQIDTVLRAPSIAGKFMEDNGLAQIIKDTSENSSEFEQYLIAKQAKDVAAQGFETGRDASKDERLIQALGSKYEAQAQQVYQYSHKLLDYITDSGLISRDTAAALKEKYPNYVPINRIFNDLELPGFQASSRGPASISGQTIIQGLEGSERAIENPLESLLGKTNDAFVQGERNKAAQILASYRDLPGFDGLIKELPSGASAQHTFSLLENGVKKTFETTPEIASAAKNLNPQQLGLLGRIFAIPARILKIGTTGLNLAFAGTNVARDQLTAFINSDKGIQTSIANPNVFLQSLFAAVNHNELYDEVVRMGAGGTSFDISRNAAKQTVESIRSTSSVGSRIKYVVTHPGELLRAVEDIIGRTEEMTRIQQYEGTKQALLKEGRTLEDAKILAAQAARENTANFYRKGDYGGVLNSTFPYLNAKIQGTRALIRGFERAPVATSAKIASTIFLPVALTTAWALSDPKRKEAYNDIPQYEKEGNIIIVPPNPTQDDQGRWNVIKIPLPQDVSKLAIPIWRGLEQAHGGDPVRFAEVANSLLSSALPFDILNTKNGQTSIDTNSIASTITPQAIKPYLEEKYNTNFFTGLPIVPSGLDRLSPELQVKPNTSGTARKIGDFLGVSPIKVESFVRETAGGVGSQILNASDKILAGLHIIPRDQIGGQDLQDAITSRFDKARGGQVNQKSDDKIREVIQKQTDENFVRNQEAEMVTSDLKSLSKDEAKQKLKDIASKDEDMAKRVLTILGDEKKGLNTTDRLIKQLNVKNGNRAEFISSSLDGMNDEDKKQYLKDLAVKNLLTKEVLSQVLDLQNKKKAH